MNEWEREGEGRGNQVQFKIEFEIWNTHLDEIIIAGNNDRPITLINY